MRNPFDWMMEKPWRLLVAFFSIAVIIVGVVTISEVVSPPPPPLNKPVESVADALTRYRDEEHHVTCYRYRYGATSDGPMSCVADPASSCSAVPR